MESSQDRPGTEQDLETARGRETKRNSPSAPGPLEGRRALVVGGTGGIGRATALALARRGAELIITGGSSKEGLQESLQEIRALGARAEGFILPISRPRELVENLPSLGRIDLLVSAFGPFLQSPLHLMKTEEWERLCLLDLALPGALASALLPGMMERGWGRFVFFGGTRTDAIRAFKTNAAYAAAKTGLAVLVKSLATEYAASGIGAFLLCPGLVDTEYLDPARRAALSAQAPGGRLSLPGEIGEFAASLAGAEPCLASGAIINLDAGLSF